MVDKHQTIRAAFLTAAFSFLGFIAHCDGPINRDEVNRLKHHMKKMRLSENEQRIALRLFKAGTTPDFNASQALHVFRAATTPKLIHILLVHLVVMARADDYMVEKELHALQWVARELGCNNIIFNHLLKMIYEQDQVARFYHPPKHLTQTPCNANEPAPPIPSGYQPHQAPRNQHQRQHANQSYNQSKNQHENHAHELQKAYKILQVTADMTEDEIRRTFKKLASLNHPDKLIGQGLSTEQQQVATEHFKEIQAAYSFIKKYRSLYAANQ